MIRSGCVGTSCGNGGIVVSPGMVDVSEEGGRCIPHLFAMEVYGYNANGAPSLRAKLRTKLRAKSSDSPVVPRTPHKAVENARLIKPSSLHIQDLAWVGFSWGGLE